MDKKENNLTPESHIPGYLKGELNPVEKKELLSWIKSDPANKRLFDEYCEIWITTLAGVKHPEYNFHEGFWKFKQQIRTTAAPAQNVVRKSLFISILKYAAIFILTASVSGISFYYIGKSAMKVQNKTVNELIVPMGSSAKFQLSDGTSVIMNAGSRLTYDNNYGVEDRVVTLEGEAFFNVAKESDKPFMVRTSHINVMALGTAFNVKAYPDDSTIETTLVEGSVKIEGIAGESSREATMLKPNQKMTFFKEDSTMVDETSVPEKKSETVTKPLKEQKAPPIHRIITENVNVEPVISWKENKWIFEKQSLEKIAVDLERRFDVEIHFESERLKSFRFTGILIAEPIEQVLEVLSYSFPIDFDLKGKVVTLSESRKFDELNKRLYNQN